MNAITEQEISDLQSSFRTANDRSLSEIIKKEVLKVMQDQSCSQISSNFSDIQGYAGKNPISNDTWIIDSGASAHMCASIKAFKNLHILNKEVYVKLPNGFNHIVKIAGDVQVSENIILKHVLYVSNFKHNLLSVNKLCKDGHYSVHFTDQNCIVQDLWTRRVMVVGKRQGRLYVLEKNLPAHIPTDFRKTTPSTADNMNVYICNMNSCNSDCNENIWHYRLGHTSMDVLRQMKLCKNDATNKIVCEACPLAKQHRMPFPDSENKAHSIFDLIHIDVWGPYRNHSINNYEYMLTIVDDYNRSTWTYLMLHKSQTLPKLEQFYNM
ncbi:UNVERIFIED_CONTAM: hypothetical protein Sindi_2311600, partial [Sesamum indicum]